MEIDAHAHQLSTYTQVLIGVHTIGIHPWELTHPFNRIDFDIKWEKIIQRHDGIYAIGECGLDRVHEGIADIEDQKYVFMKHLELALDRGLPLIVHSVRTNSDILEILKKTKFPLNILIHAFGGNDHEMHELLKYPVSFSYGARIFKSNKMLKMTPLDKLLLETGDQNEFSISEIYKYAAESLGVDKNKLEMILFKNFLTFFKKFDDVSTSDFIKDLNTRKTLT